MVRAMVKAAALTLPRWCACVWALPLALSVHAQSGADSFVPSLPEAQWRIGRSVAAPWARDGGNLAPSAALLGKLLRFSATEVQGPHPLGCGKLRHEFVMSPAGGLFQGALPEPAEVFAQRLGVSRLPVLSLHINCDTGTFDYHLLTPRRALLGLDNRVWRLQRDDRGRGPEDVVLAFLQRHMSADMAFTPAIIARGGKFFSPDLARAIRLYFSQPGPKEEAPGIDGDPFTNSQEYPTRFELGRLLREQGRAIVPVRFGEVGSGQVVRFELRRVGLRWRLDNLHYEDGASLRRLLSIQRH